MPSSTSNSDHTPDPDPASPATPAPPSATPARTDAPPRDAALPRADARPRGGLSFAVDRLPQRGTPAALILAALIAFTILASLELTWRARGHFASVVDDMDLWCVQRDLAQDADRSTIALLGWSRILEGFSSATFHQRRPDDTLAVLAVRGHHPIAALRDLANDPTFAGVVIIDITYDGLRKGTWEQQQPYVDFYEKRWGVGRRTDRWLRTQLQQRLTVVSPEVAPITLALNTLNDGPQPPLYVHVHPDRTISAHFDLAPPDELRQAQEPETWDSPDVNDQPWRRYVRGIDKWVTAIQQRGGQVVFIRMPTGRAPRIDRAQYVKHPGWRALEELSSAKTLHFADVPAMYALDCPDRAHLDQRDAPAFTNLLLDQLIRMGVITPDP